MLFEFHILQNHAPSNLNRDDTGSPKDCIFGGVKRARISSQCLKRSIRVGDTFQRALAAASVPLAERTRKLPLLVAQKVKENLIGKSVAPAIAAEIEEACKSKVTGFGTEAGKENSDQRTAQTMFLTKTDIDAVAQVLTDAALELIAKESSKAAAAFKKLKAKDLQESKALRDWRPITVDLALFGRMITSPAFQDVEASMQVAHALSTHRVEMEFDYFTAVDDLSGSEGHDELGADMIGDIEFNSACFYKYFSLDLDGLLANLIGESNERAVANRVAETVVPAFLEAAVFTTPTGKQNTFAAHNLPSAILVEVRPYAQPVSYANAFVRPVQASQKEDLVTRSINCLRDHVERTNRVFSLPTTKRLWLAVEGNQPPEGVQAFSTLPELLGTLKDLVIERNAQYA